MYPPIGPPGLKTLGLQCACCLWWKACNQSLRHGLGRLQKKNKKTIYKSLSKVIHIYLQRKGLGKYNRATHEEALVFVIDKSNLLQQKQIGC